MSFCVITAGEELPGLPILAQVLGAARKLDRDTAAAAARHCWGILGEGLGEAEAADLQGRCAEFGIKTRKLADTEITPLPAAQTIKKADFYDGRFNHVTGSEPPGDILVISAAPIKEEFLKTIKTTQSPSGQEQALRLGIMAVTGLPIGLGKSKETKKQIKSSELAFYLDIVLRAGTGRLRFTSENFDFSCLKEKKTYSSQLNFRLLAAELAAFAPGALKNSGLRAMLESKPLTLLPYDTLADFERDTLRLSLAVK